ncbi:hypothetical protein Q8A67_006061 [Cirrhinus molitorella]|uniref:Ig-like domain-containing protein n=1 Tax=Cirrhinus molitorella TaxID=172907 RepID=A0AA88U2R7_9TELE|nr:hypothetical protein Q8A67_006061 [Cirrhinus molitorella]
MDFRIASLILLLHISGSLTLNRISVTCENICALRETNVQLKCFYDNSNIKTVFWFSEKQSKNWRKNNEPEDLTVDSDYSGRVKHQISSSSSTLTISDVRERDSGEYQLMFIMNDGVKHLSSSAVSLTVTDLQVRINPVSSGQRDQRVNLTCDTSCDLTSRPQNYYWKINGQYVEGLSHSKSITVSPKAAESYSCFLTRDLMNSSSPVCLSKSGCWDVTYSSRRVCALVGSTVDISCTYSHPSDHTVIKTFWYYVRPGNIKDLQKEQQFAGRVEYVGNKLRIKDLKISDSGEYRFRFITDLNSQYSKSPGVILTVTGTQLKRSPAAASEGQEVILSCSTKCTLNDNHTYIWYKNQTLVTDGFTKVNKLYLDSVSNEELEQYSCAVGDPVDSTAFSHYTVTLLVFLPQFLIIANVNVNSTGCSYECTAFQNRTENKNEEVMIRKPSTIFETVCKPLNKQMNYFESYSMDFRIASLILLLHISGSLTLNRISVTCENICALRETNVQLKCFYDNSNSSNKTVFWFSEKQSTNWRKNNEPEDLTVDSDYSGRVKHQISSSSSTITISDVRERDSGEYQLMFIMNDGVKHLSSAAVSLTVTDLQVRINPVSSGQRDQRVDLTCDTSCDLTSRPQNYYWKINGQYVEGLSHSRSITVSPKAAESYSCFLTRDLMNSSSPVCLSKSGCWDVTYSSRRVCALVGSTVDISCTYSHPSGHTVKKTFWYYVRPGNIKDLQKEQQFAGRVEYVGNKLRIKELKISDSGEYRFRIITDKTNGLYSGSPGVILTVTGTQMKSSPAAVSGKKEVILSCSTKCTLNDKRTYIWYKNKRQVTDGFTKVNKLYLDSVSNEELQQYSCAVGDPEIQTPQSSTALLSTVIILSVFLILALIGVLWYRRRKNNSSQQHEENKESVESGSAMLYDNAAALSTVGTQQVCMKQQDVHYSTINFKQSDTNKKLAPTVVQSTSNDVHYATVKFS